MADIQVFNYQDSTVRTVEVNGETWFVLSDVCKILDIGNTTDVTNRLDQDEFDKIEVVNSIGRKQQSSVVSESGLYNIILRSNKPEAKPFRKWVTSEVLPTIRKTGTYAMQPAPALSPAQLIAAQAQLLVDMEQKMLAMEAATQAVQAQQTALSQKVDTAIQAFSRPSEDHWQADMDAAIKQLCQERKLSVTATKGRMYADLESKCGCDVNARLMNLRKRRKKQGARHKDAMALTKLDAIAADKQLRAAFELVVKEWQARSFSLEGQEAIAIQESIPV